MKTIEERRQIWHRWSEVPPMSRPRNAKRVTCALRGCLTATEVPLDWDEKQTAYCSDLHRDIGLYEEAVVAQGKKLGHPKSCQCLGDGYMDENRFGGCLRVCDVKYETKELVVVPAVREEEPKRRESLMPLVGLALGLLLMGAVVVASFFWWSFSPCYSRLRARAANGARLPPGQERYPGGAADPIPRRFSFWTPSNL